MNNLKTITKYTFKEQLFPFSPKKIISKYPKNYVGRLALFAFSYIFLGLFFFYFAAASATVYINGQNNEVMYFAMFGVILTLLLLTMYIPQMLSSFFNSSEINIMKTWPVGQGELYMGKFFGVVLGNFDFIIFFLVYLILYFVGVGFSASQLVLGIINFFSLLVIPYGIILGLILILLKFTNIGSHKKLIKNIGYILLFIFIGVIYYFSFSSGEDYGANQSEGFGKAVEAIGGISDVFFHAKIFGLAMTGPITQQLTYTLILVAIAALICFILYRLSDKYFYDAVSESGTSTKKRVEKSPNEVDFTKKSQPVAIMKRDMKNLFSI